MYSKSQMHRNQIFRPVPYPPVYVYTDLELEQDSKPLRKDQIDSLTYFRENELRLWERCYHNHVVKIFEVYDDGRAAKDYEGHESIYLLMEYADMGTLMSWDE